MRAHPMLERGVASYEDADFEAAMHTFDQAARNADLSVEELLRLFEMRALVHHAVGNSEGMNADLRRIAAVRPSYKLGALAPPSVLRAFNQILAEDVSVEFRLEEVGNEEEPIMTARLMGVPDQLVDHVSLNCKVGPRKNTVSQTTQGHEARIPLPKRGDYSECHATARTRQGGVLFYTTTGTSIAASRTRDVFTTPEYVPPTDTKRRKRWPWIVGSAALILAGGVTAAVLVSRDRGNDQQPTVGGATVNW